MELIENIERVANTLVDTLKRKNADYGSSFTNLFEKLGMPYAYGHLSEKVERIYTLMHKDAQVDESLKDSLYDLAGYAILTLAHLKQETPLDAKRKPNERYFTDKVQPKFKEGDVIRKRGGLSRETWYVKNVTATYILITNNDTSSLIYPYEQELWEKYE